jgi:hypothetical protein
MAVDCPSDGTNNDIMDLSCWDKAVVQLFLGTPLKGLPVGRHHPQFLSHDQQYAHNLIKGSLGIVRGKLINLSRTV